MAKFLRFIFNRFTIITLLILIQIGFISRTPRGRIAMPLAYEHLGYLMPDDDRGISGQIKL